MALRSLPEFPKLPWASFGPQLRTVLEATMNKLDREWPSQWRSVSGANSLFELLARSLQNTFHTILVLSSDGPQYPLRREDALSVPPLARGILDVLFTTVYLFDNLPSRVSQYYKGGWRETWEEHQRFQAKYQSDADWDQWLKGFAKMLDKSATLYGISAPERANPKALPYWPTPGQMLKDGSVDARRRDYLVYLNDWFYKHLSAQSHLSLPGLAMRAGALVRNHDTDLRDAHLDKQRSDQVLTSSLIALAFASEVQIECRFDLAERLKYIWTILTSQFGMARELYDPWYAARL